MEAIFTKSLDLSYVGPSPTINAFVKAQGREVRVIAGACSGGAALVVQADGRIKSDADFKKRRVATPQLGNTQDVAARAWLINKGFKVTMTGGDVMVIPTMNPDQLTLFQNGSLDAVWTVEPWVTRLEREAGAIIYLEESALWPQTGGRYVTTHLVTSVKLLQEHHELLAKFVAAHVELTQWINDHPAESQQALNDELKAEMGRALSTDTLTNAWRRLEFTPDPVRASLLKSAEDARRAAAVLRDLDRVLAVAEDDAETLPDGAQALLDERAAARAARDWGASDALRDRLAALGVIVEDSRDGQRWRLAGGTDGQA
mgnify:CR=1 FL=1